MSTVIASPGFFDEAPRSGSRGSVARDDDGAIMVIGVFMAFLVTGFLYYIVGIGNTIIYRERLQDAADAIAFSGAVVHARGMNIIALINIVLLVLMTVYLALRLVHATVFALTIACVFFCAPAVPALEAAERILDNMQRGFSRGILEPALTLGHTAQEVVKNTFPGIAQGSVVLSTISGTYSPPVDSGLLLPVVPYRTLPVQPTSLMNTTRPNIGLCQRAGANVSAAVTFPLSILGPVRGLVAGWLGRLLATAFCPDDQPRRRNYDLDPGGGDCSDGLPGQDCEYSQLRGVAIATRTPFGNNERGVNVASLGRATGGGALGAFEAFTHVGLAQAEYYYDGTEDWDEWCFHMYWRARFRRVRLRGGVPSIPGLSVATDIIDRIIVH